MSASRKLIFNMPPCSHRPRGGHCRLCADEWVKANQFTELHIAAYLGDTETVKNLIHNPSIRLNPKDSFGNTPLMLAVQQGHVDTVNALLETRKIGKGFWGFLKKLCLLFCGKYVRTGLYNLNDNTAIHEAVKRGHMAIVKSLLETDPDSAGYVGERKNNLLHLAILERQPILANHFAKTYPALMRAKNAQGQTPVEACITQRHIFLSCHLIFHYCDPKQIADLHQRLFHEAHLFIKITIGLKVVHFGIQRTLRQLQKAPLWFVPFVLHKVTQKEEALNKAAVEMIVRQAPLFVKKALERKQSNLIGSTPTQKLKGK